MLFTLMTTSYIQSVCRFLCLYGVRSSFNTSCCVAVTWVSCIWQELMAAEPKRNPSKITRKCQWPHYTQQLTLSTSSTQWLLFFWFSLISESHALPVAVIIHMKWWERVREVVRWWSGGKRIWSMGLRSQIKPNYMERNAPFLRSPFTLPLAFALLHFSKTLAVAQPMVCGYLFMCNLLEGWPLSPFSQKPFTILFMSTCLIQMATHSYEPRAWVSWHAFTKSYHSSVKAIQRHGYIS